MDRAEHEKRCIKIGSAVDKVIELFAAEKLDVATAKRVLESVTAALDGLPVVAVNRRDLPSEVKIMMPYCAASGFSESSG